LSGSGIEVWKSSEETEEVVGGECVWVRYRFTVVAE